MSNEKILIVEDTLTQAKTLQHLLRPGNYETSVVRLPKDAVQAAETFHPDAVLCDIMMPEINGYQLCEQFKSHPLMNSVPFILLAGLSDIREIKRILASGADGFIWKNFEPIYFLPTFQNILRRTKGEAAGEDQLAGLQPDAADPARSRLINMLLTAYETGIYQQSSKSTPATVA